LSDTDIRDRRRSTVEAYRRLHRINSSLKEWEHEEDIAGRVRVGALIRLVITCGPAGNATCQQGRAGDTGADADARAVRQDHGADARTDEDHASTDGEDTSEPGSAGAAETTARTLDQYAKRNGYPVWNRRTHVGSGHDGAKHDGRRAHDGRKDAWADDVGRLSKSEHGPVETAPVHDGPVHGSPADDDGSHDVAPVLDDGPKSGGTKITRPVSCRRNFTHTEARESPTQRSSSRTLVDIRPSIKTVADAPRIPPDRVAMPRSDVAR